MTYLIYSPYILICITTIACWFSRKAALWLAITSVVISMVIGRIEILGLVGISILFGLLALINYLKEKPKIKIALWTIFSILALALTSHLFPGFNNLKVINAVKFSENAIPFSMYLNHDKPFVGLGLLIFFLMPSWKDINEPAKFLKTTLWVFLSLTCVLIPIAMMLGYIRFDFKFPSETWIWAINNLLIVCVAEEVFFRGFIQTKISKIFSKIQFGQVLTIITSSLIFGLAHYKGGMNYIILSSVAGLFYGYTFYKTKRIESSILVHFSLNLVHFIFFSYPALLKG